MSIGSKVEGVYRGPAPPYRITPLEESKGETVERARFEVDGRETIVALDSLEPLPGDSA